MDQPRLIRSTGTVGAFTALSRTLGFARDVAMAALFGTSVWMSAFVVAFTLPNLFRRLFGEGALSAAFVPVFVQTRREEGDEAAWMLARKTASLVALLLSGLALVGIILATVALPFLPDDGRWALIFELSRVMLPYMVFICLAALSMAVLNALHHFAVPAATPSLLNLVWLAVVLGICPGLPDMRSRIFAVAWGVLVAGALQLAAQYPVLHRRGFRFRLAPDPADPHVRRVAALAAPAALGLAVTQVNTMVDRLLAAGIGSWAPAALYFSERLIYLPLGIFATALGTVLLPVLSEHAARRDEQKIRETVEQSLRHLAFIMVPAAAGLLVLATPVVRTCFELGQFQSDSIRATSLALACYAPGLLVFSIPKVFVPAFYARQDTRTPVRLSVACVALNLVLNITFVLILPLPMKHAGLAAATVLSEAVYAGLLARALARDGLAPSAARLARNLAPMLGAALLMALAVVPLHGLLLGWLAGSLVPKAAQVAATLATIAVGIALYLGLCRLARVPELRELHSALRRRRRQS